MNSTELTATQCGEGYKRLLLEAKNLRGKSGESAYRRAKLLCQVFADADFRADCGNVDDFQAAAILDEYVEDLCLSFLDLRRVLERFPRIKDWKEGRLSRLYRETMKTDSQETAMSGKPRCATADARKRLEIQLEDARKELARARAAKVSEVDQLKARIAELERENEDLRREVAELERKNKELLLGVADLREQVASGSVAQETPVALARCG